MTGGNTPERCDIHGGRSLAACGRPAPECSECGAPLTMSTTRGTPGMPVWDVTNGSTCPSGIGHAPQDAGR